jgi:hypothetical protein
MQARLLTQEPGMTFPVFREVELEAQTLVALGPQALTSLVAETAEQQEYYDLGGMDGPSPYATTLAQLDALIGRLKQVRAAVQALAAPQHEWSENAYCMVCGADGAA